MKKLLCAIGTGAMLWAGGLRTVSAGDIIYNADLVNQTGLAVDTNYDVDLKEIGSISMVAAYSTTTLSNLTFDTGRVSTATLTVSSITGLIATKAYVNITVNSASPTTLRGHKVTLNGVKFQASPGGNWTPVTTATGSAVALAAVIDAHASFEAAAAGAIVYATAAIAGTGPNSWTVTTSSSTLLTVSAARFAGGLNNARLAIQGVVFDAGTGFTAALTSSNTAKSISDALMANATLAALFTSTWHASGVVYATANAVGQNAYSIYISTPSSLQINGNSTSNTGTFLNGADSDVNLTNNTIDISNHGLNTGFGVLYTTGTSAALSGLTHGTTYYPIIVSKSLIKLATTKANAVAGTAVDITAQTTANTYTLAPVAMSGVPSFKWQGGNNSTSFVDLSVSSVTVTASGTTGWDFGELSYRYLRLKYTAPTLGGATIQVTGTGRRD